MPEAIVGVAHYNYKSGGWQEKYHFAQAVGTLVAALPVMQQIVWGRTAFLGAGAECVFARVSSTDSAHDGLMCDLPYPVGPHPSWGASTSTVVGDALSPPNEADTVFQMRFETATGKYWQRYFHCPPDTWISNKALTSPSIKNYLRVLPAGQAPGDMSPTGGLSHLLVCQNFWTYLLAQTANAKEGAPGNYSYTPIAYVNYRKVGSKRLGRPFDASAGKRQAYAWG